MAEICHDFPIAASTAQVFDAITTPRGLDTWWSLSSSGEPLLDSTYELHFGPGFDWRAVVRWVEPRVGIEWEFTEADNDWTGMRLRISLEPAGASTRVRFDHRGWPEDNDHYRSSCYCWAMYLRLLKRHLESGELVPYESRLDA